MNVGCVTRVALFSWRFIVPLTFFVFCYWKIIAALRRTAKVGNATLSSSVSQREQHTAGTSTSAADAASADAATATSSRSKPADKSQKNVVKTMLRAHYSLVISGGNWTEIHQISTRCSRIIAAVNLHIGIAISQFVVEWQCNE